MDRVIKCLLKINVLLTMSSKCLAEIVNHGSPCMHSLMAWLEVVGQSRASANLVVDPKGSLSIDHSAMAVPL